MRGFATVLTSAALISCSSVAEVDLDQRRSPIVGGELEDGFPLVGMVGIETGERRVSPFCTATAVTPTVVLTAGHCNSRIEEAGDQPVVVVFMHGDDDATIHHVDRDGLRSHEDFVTGQDPPNLNDVGLTALVEPLFYRVFPELRREPLTAPDLGTPLMVVGFGATATGRNDLGTKRSLEMEISELPDGSPEHFVIAVPDDPSLGTCGGDSGGPGLVTGSLRDVQVGVHARAHIGEGDDWLCGEGEQTSVPHFYGTFIEMAALALDPSAADCGDLICTGLETAADCAEDCDFSTCGDGSTDDVEICDDSNNDDGDGCSATCRSDETCGNGIHDRAADEACDDGNTSSGDGCADDCGSDESCGNGVHDRAAGEVCDDGNTDDGDGCSADCMVAEGCGDGEVDDSVGEVCDDGNTDDGDGCSANCRSDESCGNSTLDDLAGEICDDGNTDDGDGCADDCHSDESCGNDIVDEAAGEVCDDGNIDDGDGCTADCSALESCGDGIVQEGLGETCDDGNTDDGDGCSAACLVEEPSEEDDDGCSCSAAAPDPLHSFFRLILP